MTAVLCIAPLPATPGASGDADNGPMWSFRVSLDGQPIGEHRFRIGSADSTGDRTVISEAGFIVRWLGMAVYRYQHRAVERWRGDCLTALSAETDDNGARTQVAATAQGERFDVTIPAPQSTLGCVMSYAYWHPALRAQQRLLNAQTGRIDTVQIAPLGEAPFDIGPGTVKARGWRISGPAQSIDLWYSERGDWIGLDTRVDGGRALRYRPSRSLP